MVFLTYMDFLLQLRRFEMDTLLDFKTLPLYLSGPCTQVLST